MDGKERYENINATTFGALLEEYPNVVPAKLSELDHERYDNIPNRLSQRKDPKFLTKDEVATLVNWKLYVSREFHRPFYVSIVRGDYREPSFSCAQWLSTADPKQISRQVSPVSERTCTTERRRCRQRPNQRCLQSFRRWNSK